MAITTRDFHAHSDTVGQYVRNTYKGKVRRMAIENNPLFGDSVNVHLEFLIPLGEADELEIFRRIIQVIDVVVEGDKNGG